MCSANQWHIYDVVYYDVGNACSDAIYIYIYGIIWRRWTLFIAVPALRKNRYQTVPMDTAGSSLTQFRGGAPPFHPKNKNIYIYIEREI